MGIRGPARPTRRALRSPYPWLVLPAAILYLLAWAPHWRPTWDSAIYISLSRALAQGDGYTYMGFAHGKYPPGLPVLLVPVEYLFGDNYALMRMVMVLCAIGSVVLAYRVLESRSGRRVALAVAAMTAFSGALLTESTRVLSDVPYLLASLATLLQVDRYLRRSTRLNLALLLLLIIVSCAIRLVGVSLALAAAAAMVWPRTSPDREPPKVRVKHAAAVLTMTFAAVAGWLIRGATLEGRLPSEIRESVGYEQEFLSTNPDDPTSARAQLWTLVDRIGGNAGYYERRWADMVTGRRITRKGVIHLFAVLLITGWIASCVRGCGTLEFYVVAYLSVLLLWPSRQGERFLVPLLPFLLFFTVRALLLAASRVQCVWERKAGARLRFGSMGILAIILAAYGGLAFQRISGVIREERQVPYYQGEVAEYVQAILWTGSHAPREAVIITDRAPWVYLLGGQTAFANPWVAEPSEAVDFMERHGVTHLIVNDREVAGPALFPLISTHPERFVELERFGSQVIYAFRPPLSPRGRGGKGGGRVDAI